MLQGSAQRYVWLHVCWPLAYFELHVISLATYYAVRDFFKRLNTFKTHRDNGVLGTGINFPTIASGQLLEGKKNQPVSTRRQGQGQPYESY